MEELNDSGVRQPDPLDELEQELGPALPNADEQPPVQAQRFVREAGYIRRQRRAIDKYVADLSLGAAMRRRS